jgi:hypothetical protein
MDLQDFENDIPETHKEILRERLEYHKDNPDDVINWDDVKDNW